MWLRARCQERKEQRHQELIDACIDLYKREKFEDIKISKITKKAKWTRSNFYKYYKSKEEVFLDVLLYLFNDWYDTLDKNLSLKKELTPYSFANLWLESFEKNDMFTKLLSLSSSLIEDHSSLENAIEFKKNLIEQMQEVEKLLIEKIGSNEIKTKKFIIAQASIVQGGYHFFKLSDLKREVMKNLDVPFDHNEAKEIIIESLELISIKYLFEE